MQTPPPTGVRRAGETLGEGCPLVGTLPMGLSRVRGGLEEADLLALDDVDALEAVDDGLAGGYVELA